MKEVELSLLAKEINNHAEISTEFMHEAFFHAQKAGELLSEVKNLQPAEGFEKWFQENCSFSMKTAGNYIDLFNGEQVVIKANIQKDSEKEQE